MCTYSCPYFEATGSRFALLESRRRHIEKSAMLSLLTLRLQTSCLILLALSLLVGCAKKQSNVERGNANQELYIGIGTEPSGLDPQLTTGLTEYSVMTAPPAPVKINKATRALLK